MDIIKTGIEKVLYPLMESRRGNRIRADISQLQTSAAGSRQQLMQKQEADLSRLLLHCIQQVPAYKQYAYLKQQIMADPAEALSHFPVLTKEEFRKDPESFIALDADKSSLIANNSGGSTGRPLQFYMDRYTVEYYEAARWRGLALYGISPGSRCLMIWGNPFDLDKLGQKKFRLSERYLKNRRIIPAYGLKPEAMKEHIALMRRYRPEYIYGYAGALALFSRLMLEQGLQPGIRLKAVVSTSETLRPDDREIIKQAFGSPVVNEYGARDGGIIAYECPKGGLHLSAENLIPEVVDMQTHEPLPIGSRGLLAVTDLHNFVQPRLRYLLNDEVSLAAEPCPCGMATPCLQEIYGREDDIFKGKDGRYVHGVAFANCIKRLPQVDAFQIIQRSPEKATVLLVTKDGSWPEGLDAVKADYQELLPGTVFTWQLTDNIPPAPSGKTRYAIRNFPL